MDGQQAFQEDVAMASKGGSLIGLAALANACSQKDWPGAVYFGTVSVALWIFGASLDRR